MNIRIVFCFILSFVITVFVWRILIADPDKEVRVQGMAQGDIIIGALELHNQDLKNYPDSLNELIPSFLSRNDLFFKYGSRINQLYRYKKVGDIQFELSFDFSSPIGTTLCVYESQIGKWLCYNAQ